MAEIQTKFSRNLGHLLDGAAIDLHEESLLGALSLLGEDPADTQNPPLHISLDQYCGPYVDGYARNEPDHRAVHVALGYLPVFKDVFCRYRPEYLRLKTEMELNEILLHELSHGVAYLDPALYRRHQEHYARLTHRPDGSQRPKASVFVRRLVLADRYVCKAPLELRADEQVEEISGRYGLPRIIRIIR